MFKRFLNTPHCVYGKRLFFAQSIQRLLFNAFRELLAEKVRVDIQPQTVKDLPGQGKNEVNVGQTDSPENKDPQASLFMFIGSKCAPRTQ